MTEARFLMLVGLAGSGKSTLAKELMQDREDTVYLSSDELREELYNDVNNQENNPQVFVEMAKRTREALKSGKHVIYDATNISRKKRQGLLQQLPKNTHKTVVYVATDYKKVIEQNESRDRVVPKGVIDLMYKNLQIPIYSEGWNHIEIVYDEETLENDFLPQFAEAIRVAVLVGREEYPYELMEFLATYFTEFFNIHDLAQDSKYHSLSASRHTYYVYKYVLENYKTDNNKDMEAMLWTALLHDTGKAFCKSFVDRKGNPTRHANFIGHEHVSSQLAVNLLKRLGFDDLFIHKVATLIQFHMYLLDPNAGKEKLKRRVGEEYFKKLELLRDADNYAH
jgi:predicted kinase